MKRHFFFLLLAAIASVHFLTQAEEVSSNEETSERSKLAQARGKIESEFASKEANCYKSFAVDACLRQANVDKRAALADIKRQELAMNDLQRQQKKAELEQKARKPTATNPPVAKTDTNERSIAIVQNEAKKAEDAKKRIQDTNQKMAASQTKAAERIKKSKQTGAEAAKYQNKLREAEEHKTEVEQKRSLAAKSKAAPLAIPQP